MSKHFAGVQTSSTSDNPDNRLRGGEATPRHASVPSSCICSGSMTVYVSRRTRRSALGRTTAGACATQTGGMDFTDSGRPVARAIGLLMALAAVTLAAASLIHFGVAIPLGVATISDPFAGAAIPEAVLAVVLGAGAVTVLTRAIRPWPIALGTTLFTLAGTLFGLTITLGRGEAGDIAYHLTLVAMLVATVVLLVTPAGRRSLA